MSVAVSFVASCKLCCTADACAAGKPCRVQGLAVCWSKEAIYYILLNPAVPVVVSFVAKMLASKHAQKITYDLKAQLNALLTGRLCSSLAAHTPIASDMMYTMHVSVAGPLTKPYSATKVTIPFVDIGIAACLILILACMFVSACKHDPF